LRCLALPSPGQDFAGTVDDFIGKACQFGYFDSVTAIGGSGLDFAEKNNAAAGFFHRDVVVLHAGELFGEFGQFKVVSGKKGLRAGTGVDIFHSSPGNG